MIIIYTFSWKCLSQWMNITQLGILYVLKSGQFNSSKTSQSTQFPEFNAIVFKENILVVKF